MVRGSLGRSGALADDLRPLDRIRYWVVDYFSREAMKYQSKALKRWLQNAPFRFAPDDWFGFFRQHGWRPKELHYLVEESKRLGRPIPLPRLMKIGMRIWSLLAPEARQDEFRKFAGYALLEPA